MENFLVGMAKNDITPELGTLLYGYPLHRPADKLLDRLFVNAVAVKQNDETVVFVSSELCSMNLDNCSYIANSIAKSTGIKPENILYSCIHTHSAPVTKTSAGWGNADMDYIDNLLIPTSIKTINEAVENMVPAVLAIGTTETLTGINRREIKDGEVILGQNPDGPYDPRMTALVFKTPDGKNIGTVIHFACHPTASGQGLSITRDWPGYMIDRVEEITGAPCMYINGAEGDVGPRLSNGKTTGTDELAKEVGLIAAKDAEAAVANAKDFSVPTLKVLTNKIHLPFVEMPSLESVLSDMEKMGDPSKLIEVDISTYARLEKIKKMYEDGIDSPKGLDLTQTVIAFDNFAITPLPFEIFCNIALNLDKKSPFDRTVVFGLTGGSFGYMPTEDQIPFGGYEIGSFKAATIPGFINSMDKHIVNELTGLLNKLYSK